MVKVQILDHIKENDLRQECNFLREQNQVINSLLKEQLSDVKNLKKDVISINTTVIPVPEMAKQLKSMAQNHTQSSASLKDQVLELNVKFQKLAENVPEIHLHLDQNYKEICLKLEMLRKEH